MCVCAAYVAFCFFFVLNKRLYPFLRFNNESYCLQMTIAIATWSRWRGCVGLLPAKNPPVLPSITYCRGHGYRKSDRYWPDRCSKAGPVTLCGTTSSTKRGARNTTPLSRGLFLIGRQTPLVCRPQAATYGGRRSAHAHYVCCGRGERKQFLSPFPPPSLKPQKRRRRRSTLLRCRSCRTRQPAAKDSPQHELLPLGHGDAFPMLCTLPTCAAPSLRCRCHSGSKSHGGDSARRHAASKKIVRYPLITLMTIARCGLFFAAIEIFCYPIFTLLT
ncbi:hypothetical protein B5X24_HaOG209894 [Helicoverpa armigera]|uniref:Uncharacterized protein n=1 Tax=Helicoverpa armigera TaxID=29058 RepID=A0A2W1BHP4_HELAM|nr:hypothetical protein B5X24_HaOG209894 [Helicoverpa armigera]